MLGSTKVVRGELGEYLIYRLVSNNEEWRPIEVAPRCEGWQGLEEPAEGCGCAELAFARAVELSYPVPA